MRVDSRQCLSQRLEKAVDIKVRAAKRERIGRDIDLSGTKLREGDVETLYDLVTNIEDLLGETRATRESHTGFSSDG